MSDRLFTLVSESFDSFQESGRFSDVYLRQRKKFMIKSPLAGNLLREKKPIYSKNVLKHETPLTSFECCFAGASPLVNSSESLTEKHLRAIWYDGKFEHRGLKSVDGEKIFVISPGNWNTSEGPDFKNAQIRIGKNVLEGDVEIHLRSADWFQHNHHKDFKYDNVILHLVLFHNFRATTVTNKKGGKIPQLELKNSLMENVETIAATFEVDGYPYRSNALLGECGKAIGLPERMKPEKYDFIQILLKIAGDGRILLKGEPKSVSPSRMQLFRKVFREPNTVSELDAQLYEKICEGLGYSQNKSAMKELSQKIPYALLKQFVAKTSGEVRVRRIQAVLLAGAGLLPPAAEFSDEETKQYVSSLLSEWENLQGSLEPMKKSQWSFHGTRPHNFPTRRLAGLGYFLALNMDKGLFQSALDIVRDWGKQDDREQKKKVYSERLSKVKKFLFQPGWGYFGLRAKFGGKKFSKKVALIGEDRSLTIWVNAFLPYLVHWCRDNKDERLEEELHRFWREIPILTENRVSKMMMHRFLGAKASSISVETEQKQQGLLQLFQDFCDTKPTACTGCPFPRLVSLSVPELLSG